MHMYSIIIPWRILLDHMLTIIIKLPGVEEGASIWQMGQLPMKEHTHLMGQLYMVLQLLLT